MVERLDQEDHIILADDVGTNTRDSLGLEGLEIELQDFKDAKFPQPNGLVKDGEMEGDYIIFGKIGSKEV